MKKTSWIVIAALGLLTTAPAAVAKEHAAEKQSHQMPAARGGDFAAAEAFKRQLDAADAPTQNNAVEALKIAVRSVTDFFSRGDDPASAPPIERRPVLLKGDPKTGYVRDENRLHASRHALVTGAPSTSDRKPLMLRDYVSSRTFEYEDSLLMIYEYDTSETLPYGTVRVVYDKATEKVVSATGYTTTVLDSVPDLSSMTLVSTAVRADGSLSYQTYESAASDGTITRVRIDYSVGNTVYVQQTIIDPIEKALLPRL